jgi:hypothetical protein
MKLAKSALLVLTFTTFLLLTFGCRNQGVMATSNNASSGGLTTIDDPQGGKIVYGVVNGVTSQAAAMGSVLHSVHQQCGEKPQVGKPFRVRGSNSVAVFFTAVKRTQGNQAVAGMVIATEVTPTHFEAALVTDDAGRFGSTVNPLLQKLFSVWNPASAGPVPVASGGAVHAAATPPLHTVTAPDNSASLSVPDGWKVDSNSGRGAIIVHGPNGELLAMDMIRTAIDPTNPFQVSAQRRRLQVIMPGTLVYPFHGNLMNDFTNMFQAWRRAAGQGPAKIQVDKLEPVQAPQGNHCVHAMGHMDIDGKGMQAFNDLMCAIDPIPSFGGYSVILSHALLPSAVADKERDLQKAIITTYKMNSQVVNQQLAQQRQQKQQSDQQIMNSAQQYIGQIHQIGQQATARMAATEAANDAQHAGYWAQQDSNARRSAGFSNYLLDQTVVQNNNVAGTGEVGHATVWNSTANAMVKADPNKYEIVNTPNYWKGVDY